MAKWAERKAAQVRSDPDSPSNDKGASASSVELLFREHNDTLIRFLRARLKSDADAREAAQEAYVRLLQLDHADQPSFLRAYLFKIAANVAADMLRRKKVRARLTPVDDQVFDPGAAQEQALSARQQLLRVQEALNELPPRCRQAFLLRRQDEMTTLQIGETMGVSDRMVRLYLVRAIEHVQQALEREEKRA